MPQMSPSSLRGAVLSPEARRWVHHYSSRSQSPARAPEVARAMHAHQAMRAHAGFEIPSLVPDFTKINTAATSAMEVTAGAWASSAVGVIIGGAAGAVKGASLSAILTGAGIGALVGPFLFMGLWFLKRAVTPSPAQLEGTKPTGRSAVEQGDKLPATHEDVREEERVA